VLANAYSSTGSKGTGKVDRLDRLVLIEGFVEALLARSVPFLRASGIQPSLDLDRYLQNSVSVTDCDVGLTSEPDPESV